MIFKFCFYNKFFYKNNNYYFLLLLFITNSSVVFYAQECVESTIALETTVITATRTEKKLQNVPIKTEVIDKKTIDKLHARNAKEAIEKIPGIFLNDSYGKRAQEVSIQGFDSSRVLILIDGKRILNYTGSAVDLQKISTVDIEKIEIVKGSSSALYGSDAMGGVINIITAKNVNKLKIQLGSEAGSYGQAGNEVVVDAFRIYENIQYQEKKVNLKVASSLDLDNGFDFNPENNTTNGDEIFQYDCKALIKIDFTPKSKLEIESQFFKETKERFYDSQLPGLEEVGNAYKQSDKSYKNSLNFSYDFQNYSKLNLKLYQEFGSNNSQQDVLTSDFIDFQRIAEGYLLGSDSQYDFILNEYQNISIGVSSLYENLEQVQVKKGVNQVVLLTDEIPGKASRDNFSIFAQNDIEPSEVLEIIVGLRGQYDESFDYFVSPKFSICFKPNNKLTFRSSFGIGYRVPSIKERFYFFDHSALGYQVFGNANLKPETSYSYQAGFNWQLSESINFDLNLFYHDIDDLIGTELDVQKSQLSSLQIFTYQNIHHAISAGSEVSFNFKFNSWLKYYLAYCYLNAKDVDSNNFLNKSPNHQLKGGVIIEKDSWGTSLNINWSYLSSQYIDNENNINAPGYHIFDFSINQKIKKNTTVYIGIKNLFNVHRNEDVNKTEDLYPLNGRYIYCGIKWFFN